MDIVDRWLLPDGIEDILPEEARKLELMRRKLLDQFDSWGYEYVIPPMVEFLDSLLTGTGHDLDLKTFKVTDLVSGRMMGIRADMTPQVARMDAHSLNRPGPVRLCYSGTALHSQADNMLASRTPIKVGAELFGDTGPGGDLEIVSLMIESLRAVQVEAINIELGDVSIFRYLIELTDLDQRSQDVLFGLVQRKAMAELATVLSDLELEPGLASMLVALPGLCGDESVLEKSRQMFTDHPQILARLDNLIWITQALRERFADIEFYYDLSELRGYNYHTGIVFAAYVGKSGAAVAKGGRYDHVGEVFGRARGATGFDIQLNQLAREVGVMPIAPMRVLATPNEGATEASRWQFIRSLREQGYTVVESGELPGSFDFELVFQDTEWQLRPVDPS